MSDGAPHERSGTGVPEYENEEPPFVTSLMMQGITRTENAARKAILGVGRGVMFFLWGAGAVFLFVAVLILSIVQSPDVAGVLQGLFGGLLIALLFAVAMGWTVLWAFGPPRQKLPADRTPVTAVEQVLAPVLRELNTVRRDIVRQVKARSITRVPLGALAAAALWVFAQQSSDPPGLLAFPLWVLIGAGAGEAWAAHKLDQEYRRLYKARVLPILASRLGDLTYRPASKDQVTKLRGYRVFGDVDRVRAEDEIVGTHHGLPISIVETRLERRANDRSIVVFDGLIVEITLPRVLTGTTAILTDGGAIGNFRAQWRASALDRVRLENPAFEKRYEVYATDQVEARALLTPAFMERFIALASRSRFSLPGALAEGNRLMVALPKTLGRDLFEPPAYWKPAGGRVLLDLDNDLRAVLRVADSVMELDFWARGRHVAVDIGERASVQDGPA